MATVIGPALGGFGTGAKGPGTVYALNAASFLVVYVALLLMKTIANPHRRRQDTGSQSERAARRFGFCLAHTNHRSDMTLDFIATFFASATALLPIFATEILHVGARGYGLLGSAPAIGSVINRAD